MLESPDRSRDAALYRVLDNIKTDPDLQAIERNVAFVAQADADVFEVDVEVPSLMKRFLLHPAFETREIRVSDADRFGVRMPIEEYQNGHVTGVRGRIPVGCMKFSAEPRNRSTWSTVVTSSVLENDPRRYGDSA